MLLLSNLSLLFMCHNLPRPFFFLDDHIAIPILDDHTVAIFSAVGCRACARMQREVLVVYSQPCLAESRGLGAQARMRVAACCKTHFFTVRA